MILHQFPEFRNGRLFNEGRFWERVQAGELRAVVNAERPASVETPTIPPGSMSQEVSYYDQDNNEVARVHQYVKPDGTIGASGRPDPKRLFINGILYRLIKGGTQHSPSGQPI
jgi:hypothetical protein